MLERFFTGIAIAAATHRFYVVDERVFKVGLLDRVPLHRLRIDFNLAAHFYETIHRRRLSRTHETLDLGAREILRLLGKIVDVDVGAQFSVFTQTRRMNVEDLHAAEFVRQRDLDVHLEAAGSKQRFVDHVFTICHS